MRSRFRRGHGSYSAWVGSAGSGFRGCLQRKAVELSWAWRHCDTVQISNASRHGGQQVGSRRLSFGKWDGGGAEIVDCRLAAGKD